MDDLFNNNENQNESGDVGSPQSPEGRDYASQNGETPSSPANDTGFCETPAQPANDAGFGENAGSPRSETADAPNGDSFGYSDNGTENHDTNNGNGSYYGQNNNGSQPGNERYGAQPGGYYPNSGIPPYYGNNQEPQFGAPSKKPSGKRGSTSTGKLIFAVLICICIVISSIAIGYSVTGNKTDPAKTTETTAEQNNGNKKTNTDSGAEPAVENSPTSLAEYSGKGVMSAEQVYDTVKDSNVGVIVYANSEKAGEGSGIITAVDSTKTYTYIITCAHVISNSGISVQVLLRDGTEIAAEIVGFDTKTDVGVLRIKKTGLSCATFGNSNALTVGQSVYAIGNPGGSEFFGSFTEGMISALDRPIATSSSSYDLPCIQHSVAINPGNSGGALVNEYGQVIGLNSSKIANTEYEGMGFAVPSSTVISIYKELVANGYVTNRPMLGIKYFAASSDYTFSAIAWKNNLPYGSIVIASITNDSSLKNSDIKVGDVITSVNGKELETTDVLLELIEKSKVGDTLTLGVCRLNSDGSVNSSFTAKVKLVEDKGNTSSSDTEQTTTDPFSSYFPFGN